MISCSDLLSFLLSYRGGPLWPVLTSFFHSKSQQPLHYSRVILTNLPGNKDRLVMVRHGYQDDITHAFKFGSSNPTLTSNYGDVDNPGSPSWLPASYISKSIDFQGFRLDASSQQSSCPVIDRSYSAADLFQRPDYQS